MEHLLKVRIVQPYPSDAGPQAYLAVGEANSEEHVVRCLYDVAKRESILWASMEVLEYLGGKYGKALYDACQQALLGQAY